MKIFKPGVPPLTDMAPGRISIDVGSITYRAVLFEDENPETVAAVVAKLPFNSFLLHPNVSGKGMVIPTSIIHLGSSKMVLREPGSMYFYGPGQSIVTTYGQTTETAPVNTFAKVIEEDLPNLRKAGELAYIKTLAQAQSEEVRVTVRLDDGDKPASVAVPPFKGDWSEAIKVFEWHAEHILRKTPDDIIKVFAGIIDSGMGTGGQNFSVIMHIWSYLMTDGPNILYRFLTDTTDEEMTPSLIIRQTRRHLLFPFSHSQFLAELGLTQIGTLGPIYEAALGSIDIKDRELGLEQYRQLTGAYMTLINLLHRRVQQHFPFHLGKAFPSRKQEDIYELMAILLKEIYQGKRLLPKDFPTQEFLKFASFLSETA